MTRMYFYTFVMLLILAGCSHVAKLGALPTEDKDYLLPKSELIKKYPTIDKYEYHTKTKMDYECRTWLYNEPCLFASLYSKKVPIQYVEGPDDAELPLRQDVLNSLGAPYAVGRSYGVYIIGTTVLWYAGLPIFAAVVDPLILWPDPKRYYYFRRGRYCISASFNRSPKTFYKSLMTSWRWEEKDTVDENCR